MSRWNQLPNSGATAGPPAGTVFFQNAAVDRGGGQVMVNGQLVPNDIVGVPLGDDAAQHASIGRFLGQQVLANNSSFVQCIYAAKDQVNTRVTVLCEKVPGCCEDRCCPKDQYWMAGLYVLLAFVILTLVIGVILLVVCYQRSKNKLRKEEKEAYAYSGYGSQVGMYPGGYASYVGSTAAGPRY